MLSDNELTRLLAERVMGWKVWKGIDLPGDLVWRNNPANYPHFTEFIESELVFLSAPEEDGRSWRPLESLDDAWMVVAQMQANGWDYSVGSVIDGHSAVFERGTLDLYSDMRDEKVEDCAPTPARAICLAALATVGVEVAE